MRRQDALISAAEHLSAAGIEGARLEADLLLAFHLGLERTRLYLDLHADVPDAEQYWALVARRAKHEPLAHITGTREFWSLEFNVSPATLIPRPDTETLVELALACVAGTSQPRILDLGTGTGCILLALLHELNGAGGLGIDLSSAAIDLARKNARALGIEATFRTGSWFEGVEGRFDLIVSNPPYIPDGDIVSLEPDVRDFEPLGALTAGPEGLEAYRHIIPAARSFLNPGGYLAVEVGIGQATAVANLFAAHRYENIVTRMDLGGIPRAISGKMSAKA